METISANDEPNAALHELSVLWREFEVAAAKAPPDFEQLILAMKTLAQVIYLSRTRVN